MTMGPKPKPFDSFLRQAARGCIEWSGVSGKSNGYESHRYGRYTTGGRKYLAHRFAYMRAFGTIPAGMNVCHKCDNTLCCNPEHLFLGTQRDNVHDAMRKGRFMLGIIPARNPARGERSGSAKLTDKQVIEIRARRASGETVTAIASAYGVHHSHVSRLARGLVRR